MPASWPRWTHCFLGRVFGDGRHGSSGQRRHETAFFVVETIVPLVLELLPPRSEVCLSRGSPGERRLGPHAEQGVSNQASRCGSRTAPCARPTTTILGHATPHEAPHGIAS